MELFNPKSLTFDFVSKFKFFGTLSIALCILSIIAFFVVGPNYGIDFRGGVEAQLVFDQKVDAAELRGLLDTKLKNLSLAAFSTSTGSEFSMTAQADSKESVASAIKGSLEPKYGPEGKAWKLPKLDIVGPKVGSELRKAALLSLIYTCLLVTLYLYWRFDIRFSPGALACLAHDLVLTTGMLILTRGEFSSTVVAALLTLAGYSINDTVVVFDRIRELEHDHPGKDKKWLVNHAINSTLSRTVMTAGATLMSCAIMFFVGGPTLREFSYALFFGIVVGTYSSAFVAAPLYIWADNYFNAREKAQLKTANV